MSSKCRQNKITHWEASKIKGYKSLTKGSTPLWSIGKRE
nr:MAG TPA: hypothetical protein [Bacteriophage sp.]